MAILEILQLFIGSSGLLGVLYLVFKTGKMFQKIECMQIDIAQIKHDIKSLETRTARLEGYLLGPQILKTKGD